ncbi:class I SAM-dependent methyltransferase [Microlunatus flavus]|uniref:Methyltransferase domain-containing protein n=1 Tax=Microlunatus flavus TaxID=1036181 RepID=A0A1H9GYP0_9ACTN|nr:class I SAM-dependent methyltransferase [Microlunatus flavus]SEQ55242.1 Methyltransferase domain-containing protein [Microlunatus flavus]
MPSFDDLVAEASAVAVEGWDFSWLDGRASEERPPWAYARTVARRLEGATASLDLQTGGGEVLAEAGTYPPLAVATEGWLPNLAVAADRLRPRGVTVLGHDGATPLPFVDGVFDLVTSRHPVSTDWPEIARVLAPGGTYLSQQVGPASMVELSEAFLGPLPDAHRWRRPEDARAAAERCGLEVVDLRSVRLRAEFADVGAIVYVLRTCVWWVPDFSVERYRPTLRRLHDRMVSDGPFVAHSSRFLVEARRPDRQP